MKRILSSIILLSSLSLNAAKLDDTVQLALKGDAMAQFDLALSYDFGDGIEQDLVKAIKWYQASAIQGLEEAQVAMAMYYEIGKGVKQDYNESAKWYLKAATQGSLNAQLAIAKFYNEGKGVREDKLIACAWYMLAAESGDLDAKSKMEEFSTELSEKELSLAKRLKETYKSRMRMIKSQRRA